ncbi:uncharacterized protein LOC119350456 [Triticum dicoccoides]|uniref:uncharacterized protein LOC119350456 n=1 Tax=Triticum dicoccoides TaxID=85692 RepID=UPI00188F6665|nr:uncharacterized protein LOC119350456 [Triticum dicoccoides]
MPGSGWPRGVPEILNKENHSNPPPERPITKSTTFSPCLDHNKKHAVTGLPPAAAGRPPTRRSHAQSPPAAAPCLPAAATAPCLHLHLQPLLPTPLQAATFHIWQELRSPRHPRPENRQPRRPRPGIWPLHRPRPGSGHCANPGSGSGRRSTAACRSGRRDGWLLRCAAPVVGWLILCATERPAFLHDAAVGGQRMQQQVAMATHLASFCPRSRPPEVPLLPEQQVHYGRGCSFCCQPLLVVVDTPCPALWLLLVAVVLLTRTTLTFPKEGSLQHQSEHGRACRHNRRGVEEVRGIPTAPLAHAGATRMVWPCRL